jgi:RES domain-containing protein
LARRIVRAPLQEIEVTLCRAVREIHLRRDPPRPLYYEGSLEGGRYTPRAGPAGLYLASDPATAFAEIRDLLQGPGGRALPLNPHDPVTLVYVEVDLGGVLDLTNPDIRRQLRVSKRQILSSWEPAMLAYLHGKSAMPLTQRIAEAAHLTGVVGGILYPSARWEGGRCLVVFPDRVQVEDRVQAYDTTGKLSQRLAPSAA